ncbi:hypothetical protein SUGI_0808820 [Cryptomeria japonica]|uniref:calvin cycle protein CP12-1, chloroplastic n=1 Tax=Cryptomeria japonica TaxID=3369 RepID=UPI002414A401|nr:calvin cycle protein CP12-1, chloroplastic [Cryptomeria japonica]GLJ39586.1 hypothetical protein SUGI_0808820 [Cryptomeria japonica]
MAASMATTSTVPKALFFPSNNAVPLTPKISSSMKFQPKPHVGRLGRMGLSKRSLVVAMAVPPPPPAKEGKLSDAVQQSIANAKERCAEDENSGECAAAWDEVEELSATRSDIRTKEKGSDPLEAYCKENPETDECRTYDD